MASLSPHRVENLPQKGRYRYPQPTVPEQKRVLLECPISQESPRIRSLVHVNDHKNRLSSVKMSRLAIYDVKLQILCTSSCIELWISHVAAELCWLVNVLSYIVLWLPPHGTPFFLNVTFSFCRLELCKSDLKPNNY